MRLRARPSTEVWRRLSQGANVSAERRIAEPHSFVHALDMNRLSIRADDVARVRTIVRGFGGGYRATTEFREIAWRCKGATDAELAAAAKALIEGDRTFAALARHAAGDASGSCTAVSMALQLAHVPDDAFRAQLKDLFCALVAAIAGRPLAVDRRRRSA